MSSSQSAMEVEPNLKFSELAPKNAGRDLKVLSKKPHAALRRHGTRP